MRIEGQFQALVQAHQGRHQGLEYFSAAVMPAEQGGMAAQGDGAFMMEQERPDVFTIRVGNVKPRQAATIRLTYVSPLEIVDRSIRITFPTTVAPIIQCGFKPKFIDVEMETLNLDLDALEKAITAKTKGLDETGSSLNFNATKALP